MPAVIVLGDQLQVFRANDAVSVRDLQPGVREHEVSVLEMQMVRRGHSCASVTRGALFITRIVERHIHPGLEFIVQDHTSNVLTGSEQIGFGLSPSGAGWRRAIPPPA